MPKNQTVKYVCSNCGAEFSTWSGKCYACGEWNTINEQISELSIAKITKKGTSLKSVSIASSLKSDNQRMLSGIKEFDTLIGGGIVKGSVSLIAGQPGIGKSTLLLQLAANMSKNINVLYVSGEESAHQIGLRASRLGIGDSKLKLATSSSTDDIASSISGGEYQLVVVDSIQTISCSEISSAQGSVSQITNSTQLLSVAAKNTNTAILIVGHVTKEGSIAGPKILEHLVDVVLQLEGDKYGGFKIFRAAKNRYGSTSESGIFEMTDKGMVTVDNPSAVLLSERQVTDGSIVLATMEGSRPLLVEVQSLVNRTNYGYPKRAASGIDINRLNLLIAMLERRTKLNLGDQDIYVNIVGGIKITEPASDLAICMAIASAAKGMQLKKNVAVFGEIGLSGEIRHVPYIEKRIKEAEKLGMDGAVGPDIGKKISKYSGIKNIKIALNSLLEKE